MPELGPGDTTKISRTCLSTAAWGVLLATVLTLAKYLTDRSQQRRYAEELKDRELSEARERERRETYDRLMRAEDARREKGLPALPRSN